MIDVRVRLQIVNRQGWQATILGVKLSDYRRQREQLLAEGSRITRATLHARPRPGKRSAARAEGERSEP